MKQRTVRIVCWIMAALMLFGVVAAIFGIFG
jgi:hypothetical protein